MKDIFIGAFRSTKAVFALRVEDPFKRDQGHRF